MYVHSFKFSWDFKIIFSPQRNRKITADSGKDVFMVISSKINLNSAKYLSGSIHSKILRDTSNQFDKILTLSLRSSKLFAYVRLENSRNQSFFSL